MIKKILLIIVLPLILLMLGCDRKQKHTEMKKQEKEKVLSDTLDKDLQNTQEEIKKFMKEIEENDKTEWPKGHESSGTR